ncbi:MAG: DUF1292 domain-containing protein [Lachnospiraceae bacterium]|nr:DUF1292 domain-containing protein [Lachnospiraceae bacterium]
MEGFEPIVLTDEEGNEVTCYIVDTTRIAGVEYLLAAEEGEDGECVIFRMTEDGGDYVMDPVTDESEIEYISKVFSEQNEDIDIE